jgi:alkanesulfonate monooxygenase SsuD/methylene tetrahydromethanopterin reductase-like flavin-dependent oxidoreductase (luciferase family)
VSVRIGFKTSPQGVDWATVDATWARAAELGVFESAWLNDHLTDMNAVHPGPSLESLTLAATLAHRVPGLWVGHGVLSNTFRHPVVVAKAATVLDHATGGRFILGLGAGWFEGEHEPLGLELPPIGERIDRLISAVEVIRALFSPAAAAPPGINRPDRFYPLAGAVNAPAPTTAGGPPIYLGGQGPRGIRLAARAADGWLLPGPQSGNAAYFGEKRDAIVRALEDAGRDPAGFDLVGQVMAGADATTRAAALDAARELIRRGATHLVIGVAPALGPAGIEAVAREVAEPLRASLG